MASATLTAWSSTEVVLRLTTCASRPHGLTKYSPGEVKLWKKRPYTVVTTAFLG